VLIEKPMALSKADALGIVKAANRAQRVLMIGHTFEFNRAVHQVKQQIASHELGQITQIHSTRLQGRYSADVSVIWDMIPHDISIMNYLLDSKPDVVTASGSSNNDGIVDTTYVKLEYSKVGVICHIECSWLGLRKVRDITVVGSRRMAIHENVHDFGLNRVQLFDLDIVGSPLRVTNFQPPRGYSEPLAMQIQHFLSCIYQGTEPQTDGYNGLAVVEVLEAIDRSIVLNQPVRVQYLNG
jgi:predicted dehydrogenase